MTDVHKNDLPPISSIIFILFGTIEAIVGVIGNTAILVTVVRTKTLRSPHYIFIANLAVGDLTITGYTVPHMVLNIIMGGHWSGNRIHCFFSGYLLDLTTIVSTFTVVLITINRYLNVCNLRLYKRLFSRTNFSPFVGCSMTWLIAFLVMVPGFTPIGTFDYDSRIRYCTVSHTSNFWYHQFVIFTALGVPLVLIVFCNFAIWRNVRLSNRLTVNNTSGERRRSLCEHDERWAELLTNDAAGHLLTFREFLVVTADDRESIKASEASARSTISVRTNAIRLVTPDELALLKTVITLCLCLVVLFTPFMVVTSLDERSVPRSLFMVAALLVFANSCINCLAYGLMIPEFRHALFQSVCSRCRCRCCSSSADGRRTASSLELE